MCYMPQHTITQCISDFFYYHAVPMLTVIENIENANDELLIVAILA